MSMPICPNCALPVRDGARFCTSCGARIDGAALPYAPPPIQPQYAPEWDSEPAAPAWPSPPAATTWPGQERQWSPQGASWPGGGAGGWPDPERRTEPELEPEPMFGLAADLPFDPVAYEAIHGAPPPDFNDVPASAVDVVETVDAVVTADAAAAADEETFADVTVDAVVADAWVKAQLPPPDFPTAAVPRDDAGGELSDPDFAPPPAAPVAAAAAAAAVPVAVLSSAGATDAAAARVRAAELLTELRDLLPRLSNPSGADPAALAAVLEAGIASDRERWSDLRAVMEAARDRPRDVETVLALSQQVDSVIALIDRHEQLTAAVQQAARQLRGQ